MTAVQVGQGPAGTTWLGSGMLGLLLIMLTGGVWLVPCLSVWIHLLSPVSHLTVKLLVSGPSFCSVFVKHLAAGFLVHGWAPGRCDNTKNTVPDH